MIASGLSIRSEEEDSIPRMPPVLDISSPRQSKAALSAKVYSSMMKSLEVL